MEPDELLEYLRRTAETVVPFVGSGLATPAGAPCVDRLAAMLAEQAGVAAGSLLEVTGAACRVIGEPATKAAVAEIINSVQTRPTPALVALAQWPAQRILTTNYDSANEDAAKLVSSALSSGLKCGTMSHGTNWTSQGGVGVDRRGA
jgi:hypothetical protein